MVQASRSLEKTYCLKLRDTQLRLVLFSLSKNVAKTTVALLQTELSRTGTQGFSERDRSSLSSRLLKSADGLKVTRHFFSARGQVVPSFCLHFPLCVLSYLRKLFVFGDPTYCFPGSRHGSHVCPSLCPLFRVLSLISTLVLRNHPFPRRCWWLGTIVVNRFAPSALRRLSFSEKGRKCLPRC